MREIIPKNIDEYIANSPKESQLLIQQLRQLVQELVPDVKEKISYGIPTFVYKKKNLLHIGGYKNHIGFYPGAEVIEVFDEKLKSYKISKGTLQLPLKTLPKELLKELILFRKQAVDVKQ